MRIDGFDWDAGNWPKCGMHGVSREDIERLLLGEPRVAPDIAHSQDEDRFIAIGHDSAGRALFVGFTFRERDGSRLLRPITARYMHAKEVQRYGA